jgi:radical SAM superfamily enzyme YgiQ (UPF0313 family)
VVGGPWATAEYRYILKKGYADYVVIGEGERTLLDLLNTENDDIQNLSKIPGLFFLYKNELRGNFQNKQIENLDAIPHPIWDKFPPKKYTRSCRERPMYPFITSRGCPYGCINCTKIIHGFKMRYRSIENMLEELDYLKKLGAKEIAIEDDMLNLDLKRIKILLLAIIKKKYNFRIQLSNGIRADRIDRTFARLLYAAGVYRVALGVESGSQKVIQFLGKQLDLRIIPQSVKILQDNHIKVLGYFIMGLPIERYQSLLYSITFATKAKFDIMVFLKLVVFPGTKLHEYVIKHTNYPKNAPIIHQTMNYQYTPLQFTTPYLNNSILKKVNNYYLINSFLNPKRFFRYIGSFTLVELIEQMIRNFQILTKRLFLRISYNNQLLL